MKTFISPIGYGDSVTVTATGSIKLRNCTVTAVKFEEERIRYDVMLSGGLKLYDVPSGNVELTETAAINIAKSELL